VLFFGVSPPKTQHTILIFTWIAYRIEGYDLRITFS
jgi:hypothetical protein